MATARRAARGMAFMLRACLLSAFCLLLPRVPAAAEPPLLRPGLSYVLPAGDGSCDLPATGWWVLDARGARPQEAASAILRSLQPAPDGKARGCLVLVDADTPAALLSALHASRGPGVLLVGPAGLEPPADMPVRIDADANRAQRDALHNGTGIPELAAGTPGKTRFDEAALIEQFKKNGRRDIDGPAEAPADAAPGEAPGTPPPAADDVLLQRAAGLHAALEALGRLPPAPKPPA